MLEQSPRELARVVFARIIDRRIYGFRTKTLRRAVTPDRLLRSSGYDGRSRHEFITSFKRSLRQRFFLSDLNRKEFYIHLMTSLGGFDSIMDDADLVHENKYRTLGSELYSFGEKMDWHLDFKSGKRWPLAFYSDVDVIGKGGRRQEARDRTQESGGGRREQGERNTEHGTPNIEHADVKVPWEVSRFHQAIWLGKAYWISHSEAHTEKYVSLVNDWIENNPAGYGVNWVTPMEAAIRAMNLIVGFLYFLGSNRLSEEFVMRFLCSMYEHGVYIRHNLERSLRNGNHYVSDLVGLVYIGFLLYDTKAGKRWVNFAHRELEKEIMNQVCEDGTDYEKSASYQRLVAELLTSAYVLLKLNNFNVSGDFHDRLEKMVTFLASATMHDGRTPNIGDADDGRVFRMKSEIGFNDHRDIISLGAALFGRSDLKTVAPNFSELALLLLGGGGFERFSSIQVDEEKRSMIFREGGFAFLKTRKDFCSFDFGDIGQKGRGGHGHNDVLSLTISGRNQFLVDRGTYCYTCDTKLRNKLRSTYSHNTAVVDGVEQADFAGLWSVKEDRTFPELLRWNSNDEQDIVEAQHYAYERLVRPVTHGRKLTFNKHQRTYLIEDNFTGDGEHTIELMFHFAPGLKVTGLGKKFIALEGEEYALLKFQHDFTLEKWEHSPSYGLLQEAQTAHIKLRVNLPVRVETFVFVISSMEEMNHILNRIQ